jgi:hypothetical protein
MAIMINRNQGSRNTLAHFQRGTDVVVPHYGHPISIILITATNTKFRQNLLLHSGAFQNDDTINRRTKQTLERNSPMFALRILSNLIPNERC